MGDMGEFWNDFNQARQEKRAKNRESSPGVLEENGINFTSHNGGAHLIVKAAADEMVDFWPGTGKWISRRGARGRGIFNLVKYCKAVIHAK